MARKKVTASNVWSCQKCDLELDHAEMMKHIREVHGIDTKTTKASRQMVMHLDCADSYMSTYEWTIKDLKFTQCTVNPRRKDDPMRDQG